MSSADTPMMQQYKKVREKHPGFLLFYRMGDFYELFGEDAIVASQTLQITLTRRRSSKEGDEGIPMCGVPFHAVEGYIARLLKAGHKVALCEQTETPEQAKKRGGHKALVRRDVTRLFTSGTLTEEELLDAHSSNWLAVLATEKGQMGLAWLDLSTGEFYMQEVEEASLTAALSRINPQELVLDAATAEAFSVQLAPFVGRLTSHDTLVDLATAEDILQKTFEEMPALSGGAMVRAAGALVDYVHLTQMGRLPTLGVPRVIGQNTVMMLDASTRRNLEITETLQGEMKGSLMWAVDQTVTSAGARTLAQWLNAPSTDRKALNERQEALKAFGGQTMVRSELRDALKQTADMGRALSRLTLERGGPRDLAALRNTLSLFPNILNLLKKLKEMPDVLKKTSEDLCGFDSLSALLTNALQTESLPLLVRDGGFVAAGFCNDLDGFRHLSQNGLDKLRQLERQEAERTGISSLKVKYNKVWGYFFEVTKTHADRVPDDFIHRQTTSNAQRFSTASLMQLAQDIGAAEQNALAREMEVFHELTDAVQQDAQSLLIAAEALATLDVLAAGAELEQTQQFVLPTLTDDTAFEVKAGRHPVVDQMVENFVANDADLSAGKFWLITGPNMAGKSTFLRQNALIAILAQIGYPVPAKAAIIGLVDGIFTRIGASDDLAGGRSTFMVEMTETADILKGATSKSLVILDEIGRGTATYDGLAIAWACVEHLVTRNQCRGLFATHYHELTTLSNQHRTLENHHVAVKEWKGDIVFVHQLKSGPAPGSYGVHVARLAGLPGSAVQRAEDILQGLERSSKGKKAANAADLPLFTNGSSTPVAAPQPSAVEGKISEVNLDDLTPRQAQNLLYELRQMVS